MANDPSLDRPATEWQPLRLAVVDTDDLAVVSAHLQEAETTLADMAYLPRTKRFALVVDRFDWTAAAAGTLRRCRTGLHFERVLKVARRGFPVGATDQPALLLAIAFLPEDVPSGTVLLTFANGGQIRLTVECIEAEMHDMGAAWTVSQRPSHALDAGRAIG